MPLVTNRIALADVIAAMPFGKLLEVAKDLVEMNEDEGYDRDTKTALGMAKTLYDWAEAQIEQAEAAETETRQQRLRAAEG